MRAPAAPHTLARTGLSTSVRLKPHGASASVAYLGFIDTDMVHRTVDADPLADRLLARATNVLRKRLPPSAAGAAIVRGIERRQARIIRPRRWAAVSVLRGILNPLTDAQMERDEETQQIMRELEARAGERISKTTIQGA